MCKPIRFFIFIALLLPLAACEQRERETETDFDRAGYRAEVDADLASLDRSIQDLESRARDMAADTDTTGLDTEAPVTPQDGIAPTPNVTTTRSVEDLRADYERLREEANQIDTVSEEEWRDFTRDFDRRVDELEQDVERTRLEMIQDREEFQQTVQTEMNELDQEIQDLEARAARADESARVEIDQAIANLRQERAELAADFDALQNATEDEWQDAKNTIINGWNDLKRTFRNIDVPDVDVDVN